MGEDTGGFSLFRATSRSSSRTGNHCVVDPTPEEEACSSASLVIGVVPDGRMSAIR